MRGVTVDCRGFMDKLEGLLQGKLTDAELRAAETHRSECESCRRLVEPPADLTASILAATSGPPCAQSEIMLCDHVDGACGTVDAELMRGHLEHCAECAALGRVLVHMSGTLPELAEIEPDPAFLEDVLRVTLPARSRFGERLAAWTEAWRRVLQRPRIAWEGAYLGTFVLALLFAAPGSPLAAVSHKALELARTDPAQELKAPAAEIEVRISNGYKQARGAIRRIKTDLGTVWDRFASEKETGEDETPQAGKGPKGERT